ncbi:aminoacyl-tRNA hydrolase [Devosia nitrariae]|uniref:Peptidyl-tRNA hydrolase n=1 Tax=Devosia nitrariae TaxID=2071872 RepID=A0ABQ5W7W2_9HYPH|nr:aminoacyl-tRNA hydrolase [Devosia nitrariae]GLQ56067.1 peptidyl-tRNA hydrolase [Devosia nitrariae]
MQLFVGLGNPGSQYQNHRHNVGFMAADAIAREHGFGPWRQKFGGLLAEGTIGGEKVLILKPQTFMNRSGDAVQLACQFYKIDPEDVTVFYDELDLAQGKVRIKRGGGNGGHNGLRSIDPQIGTNYKRVRIGIGHPGVKELVTHHVLGDFAKADREWLEPLLETLARNANLVVKGDDSGLMNKLALALGGDNGDKPERPAPKAQSHIRQARPAKPQAKVPEAGPMASMLQKLFKGK